MKCRHCKSRDVVKNGKQPRWRGGTRHYYQKWLCNKCGRVTTGGEVKK